ncbi:protein of unknown function [Pararobbsia alpina]
MLRVAGTLGLIEQLEAVFTVQPVSIEQMEAEAASRSRQRARRKTDSK